MHVFVRWKIVDNLAIDRLLYSFLTNCIGTRCIFKGVFSFFLNILGTDGWLITGIKCVEFNFVILLNEIFVGVVNKIILFGNGCDVTITCMIYTVSVKIWMRYFENTSRHGWPHLSVLICINQYFDYVSTFIRRNTIFFVINSENLKETEILMKWM